MKLLVLLFIDIKYTHHVTYSTMAKKSSARKGKRRRGKAGLKAGVGAKARLGRRKIRADVGTEASAGV
jgi:hypothetical protein